MIVALVRPNPNITFGNRFVGAKPWVTSHTCESGVSYFSNWGLVRVEITNKSYVNHHTHQRVKT